MKRTFWMLWAPLIALALFTPFSAWLDMEIARYFYEKGAGNVEHFMDNNFLDFIYVFVIFPALLVAIVAMIALILSYCIKKCYSWRPHALFLVLVLVVGNGFIVHAVFKENWGRPRPKQVIAFGGNQEFRPYYEPNFFNQPEQSKSFSSGHATMGFYFFALALMGRRFHNKTLEITGWTLALSLGIVLSLTRLAQGGHFLSDVIISALIMWYTALLLDWLIYEEMT